MTRARAWRCGAFEVDPGSTVVMGIVNVTPDSFSDGGRFPSAEAAIDEALAMVGHGAAIIDVGGESTRPGSDEVGVDLELDRVLPVVRGLASAAGVPVSIDTRHAETARICLDAGASIINDVSGFRDPAMVEVAGGSDCGCVIMHMRGEPKTMQSEPPVYDDVVREVLEYLLERAAALEAAGVASERVAIDPGIGFGKTVRHNLELLARLDEFVAAGYPVVLGASRKSFIGTTLGIEDPSDRLEGSLAAAAMGARVGVTVVRAHDVVETVRAVRMAAAVRDASASGA